MRLIPSLLLLPCLTLAAPAQDSELRGTLEKNYYDWRSALVNRNLDAWKRATSSYRQVVTRNLIVSQNQPYPDAIFAIPIQPPDISKLRMLEVEAKGTTAHMVYFGKVDLGLDADTIPENIFILKFIQENGVWRFDTTRFMNLAGVPDIRAKLQNGIAEFLDKPEFNPVGTVPATPPVCNKPEFVGTLQVTSLGYETSAKLNGYDYQTLTDTAEQQIIIGGLNKGRNELKLKIKALPVEPEQERILEVNAIVMTGEKDRPAVRVFTWETKSGSPPAEIELPVWVSSNTLRAN